MEKRIIAYEKYIEEKMKKGVTSSLISYHREMLQNFQHERLVHLIIMLFFVFITVIMSGVCLFLLAGVDFANFASFVDYLPTVIATVLLWILSIAYVKHYYFLENHIQGLYNVSKKLFESKKI